LSDKSNAALDKPTAPQSLSGKAKRGGVWVLLGKAFEAGSRLVSNVILAWLLFPEAFGVMIPVGVFMAGLRLFSDVGIGPSIVRSKRGDDPVFLRTVWTIQVIRGFLLYAICLVIAEPYAQLVGEVVTAEGMREQEVIEQLLLIVGLSPFVMGFRSPAWFTLDRQIAQGRKTLITVISQVVSLIVTITWAYFARSPIALVGGGVANALTQSVLSHLLLPCAKMRFQFERKALRELFGFGRWIFLSTALFFLASQIDRIILTDLLETGPRGLYRIGDTIAALVPTVLSAISAAVVFPTWMKSYRDSRKNHEKRVLRSRKALLALAMSGVICIVTIAPLFIEILYADEYLGAVLVAQLLCIAYWFETLRASATSALLVHGDSRALSGSNFIILLVKVPACWYGFQWFGLEGFILGVALGTVGGLLRLHLRLWKHGTRLLGQDALGTLALALLATIGFSVGNYSVTLPLFQGILLAGVTTLILAGLTIRPAYQMLLRKSE